MSDHGDRDTLAEVIARHDAKVGPITGRWTCACGVQSTNGSISDGDLVAIEDRRAEYRAHLADALGPHVRAAQAEALRETAAWIADSIGYPVEVKMPDQPMPDALWEALVDHVHVDTDGKWHGNTLDADDTEAWLADEAGRAQ